MAVTLGEALNIMDRVDAIGAAVPFSIKFCTYDKTRLTGGKVMTLKKAVRAGAAHSLQKHRQVGVKPADGSGHQYAVHLRLILRVNGQPVML